MSLKLHLFIWVFSAIFCLGLGVEAGAIYEWIDKDGVRHFTDGPPPPGAQMVEGLTDTPSDKSPPQTGAANDGNKGAVEGDEPSQNEIQDAEAVEGGEKGPSSREDYWRSRGWGNGPPNPDDSGTIADGERIPADSQNAGAVEDAERNPIGPDDGTPAEEGEKDPGGNEDQWRSRGW